MTLQLKKTELIYEKDLSRAVEILKTGGVVAFPTETVYGLGASIFDVEAIKSIFQLKGRPLDNPLIAHISDLSNIEQIAKNIPSNFYKLADRFYPGPLTIVVQKSDAVPLEATGGLQTIAIRMPKHATALSLIRLVGSPLVAPSANLSGKPSATDFLHVLEDFEGEIPAVIIGKEAELGIESTVVSLVGENVEILRPGIITKEEIQACLGEPVTFATACGKTAPKSPGMKYRHYAPEARVNLYRTIEEAIKRCEEDKECKRMVLSNQSHPKIDPFNIFSLEASSFYAKLRLADRNNYDEILIICDESVEKNPGFMNRIERASGVYLF